MSDSLIEYFVRSVTLKQNKYPNDMETALIPQIRILLSEIYRWDIESKTNFYKAIFEITITHLIHFSEKHFGFWQPSIKN